MNLEYSLKSNTRQLNFKLNKMGYDKWCECYFCLESCDGTRYNVVCVDCERQPEKRLRYCHPSTQNINGMFEPMLYETGKCYKCRKLAPFMAVHFTACAGDHEPVKKGSVLDIIKYHIDENNDEFLLKIKEMLDEHFSDVTTMMNVLEIAKTT